MTLRAVMIAMLSAAALAAAGVAHADPAAGPVVVAQNEFASPSTYGPNAMAPRRTLEWDANKGRWGLNLGVEQHATDQNVQWKDVSPGVYYRLTKRLHIGGAVSLAPDQAETLRMGQPQLPAPRVKLETTFKF